MKKTALIILLFGLFIYQYDRLDEDNIKYCEKLLKQNIEGSLISLKDNSKKKASWRHVGDYAHSLQAFNKDEMELGQLWQLYQEVNDSLEKYRSYSYMVGGELYAVVDSFEHRVRFYQEHNLFYPELLVQLDSGDTLLGKHQFKIDKESIKSGVELLHRNAVTGEHYSVGHISKDHPCLKP